MNLVDQPEPTVIAATSTSNTVRDRIESQKATTRTIVKALA